MSNYAFNKINMNDVFFFAFKLNNVSPETLTFSEAINYLFYDDGNVDTWDENPSIGNLNNASLLKDNNLKGAPVVTPPSTSTYNLKKALEYTDFILRNSDSLTATDKVTRAISIAKNFSQRQDKLKLVFCDAIGDVRSSFNNNYLDFNEFGLYNYDIYYQQYVENANNDNRYLYELIYNRLAWDVLYSFYRFTIRNNVSYSSSYIATYYQQNNINYNFLMPSEGWIYGWSYDFSVIIDNTNLGIYHHSSNGYVENYVSDYYANFRGGGASN